MSPGSDPVRLRYPATERNREPILEVLRRVLPPRGTVLEIASGSGEHAAFFAAALPGIAWQPSDPDPRARQSIAAWAAESDGDIRAPFSVDAADADWEAGLDDQYDAIVCINMVHVAPWAACRGLMRGAGALLGPGGSLFLYGPFMRAGRHTAPGNEAFDSSLRANDPDWGVRDLDHVTAVAGHAGLAMEEIVEMPANNLSVVFRRGRAAPGMCPK